MTTGESVPPIPGTQRPASLRETLPGRYYTDPAIFAAEQERIFEAGWFCAVLAADIPTAGSFETVQVGRESVIVSRGRDGAVNAYLNVCRHRGARLCTEEKGSVRRSFQCPYHAWTYGLDGKLITAPNLGDMPDVDRVEYGLNRVAVREWLGYVWLCLAEEPPSFDDTVVADVAARLGSPDAIVGYQVADLKLGRRIEYDVAANWKQIVENFMECYHCATIHPELTEVLPEFANGFAAQYFVGHGAEFGEEVHGFTVDGSEGLERLPGIAEDQDRRYYAITVRPQVFVNLVPDHVVFHRMFPMGPDRTVVRCDWLYLPGVVDSGADIDRSVELFHRVNQQDFDACERCQLSMDSRSYAHGGVLVPSEHHIGEFHDWVRERVEQHPTRTAPTAAPVMPAPAVPAPAESTPEEHPVTAATPEDPGTSRTDEPASRYDEAFRVADELAVHGSTCVCPRCAGRLPFLLRDLAGAMDADASSSPGA